jgi:hypothetical protein
LVESKVADFSSIGGRRIPNIFETQKPRTPLIRVALPAAAGAATLVGAGAAALFLAGVIGEPAQSGLSQAAASHSESRMVAARSATVTQRPALKVDSAGTDLAANASEALLPAETVALKKSPVSGSQTEAAAAEPLPDNDARWAHSIEVEPADPRFAEESPDTPEPIETAELQSKLERLQADGTVPAAEDLKPTDAVVTSTVAPRQTVASSPAPEMAKESAASENAPGALSDQTAADDLPVEAQAEKVAAVDTAAETQAPVPEPKAATAAVRRKVTTHVNMRSGPDNNASVVTVVPAGGAVQVIGGCKYWCEVSFDGKKGFVYKSFIGG